MDRSVAQYQKAFNNILEKLKNNNNVLAVMVFGSMVTGDLWDESDIDLFVIMEKEPSKIKNIYTEENEIDVHIKLMSKDKFLKLDESDLRGGFIHRIFASSRLVFSKNSEITARYNDGRYFPDIDRERWNMVYLGKVIKSIDLCKKYHSNESSYNAYTAYSICVRCIEDFAKLYVNSSGYMISKDAMIMAMNLNDDYKDHVERLFFSKENPRKNIEDTIEFLQRSVDKNLKNCTSLLLDYMKSKDRFFSSEDIKKEALFESFDIDFEDILNYLWKKDMIKKNKRKYKDNTGGVIVNENVYFI